MATAEKEKETDLKVASILDSLDKYNLTKSIEEYGKIEVITAVCDGIKYLIGPNCHYGGAQAFLQKNCVLLLHKVVQTFKKLYCSNSTIRAKVLDVVWSSEYQDLQENIIACMLLLTIEACRSVQIFEISFLPRELISILLTLWVDTSSQTKKAYNSADSANIASQIIVVLEAYCRSCLTFKGVMDGEKVIVTYDFMSRELFESTLKYKKLHEQKSVQQLDLSYERDVYINIAEILERISLRGQQSINIAIPYIMSEEQKGNKIEMEKIPKNPVVDECSQLLSALSMLVVFPSIKIEFVQNAGFMHIATITAQSSIPNVVSNCLGVIHACIFNLLDYQSQYVLNEIALTKKRIKRAIENNKRKKEGKKEQNDQKERDLNGKNNENASPDSSDTYDSYGNESDVDGSDSEIDEVIDPKDSASKLTLFSLVISSFIAIDPVILFKTIIEKRDSFMEISKSQYEKVIFAIIMIIHDGIHPETANEICTRDVLDIVMSYFVELSGKMQSKLTALMEQETKKPIDTAKSTQNTITASEIENRIHIIQELGKICNLDENEDNAPQKEKSDVVSEKLTVTAVQRIKACIECFTRMITIVSGIETTERKKLENEKEKSKAQSSPSSSVDKVEEVKLGTDMKKAKDNSDEYADENCKLTFLYIFNKFVHSNEFIHSIVNYLFFASDIIAVKYAVVILSLCGSYDLKNTEEADKWVRTDVDVTSLIKWAAHFGSEILQSASDIIKQKTQSATKEVAGQHQQGFIPKETLNQQLNTLEDISMAIVWLTETYLPRHFDDKTDNSKKDDSTNKTKIAATATNNQDKITMYKERKMVNEHYKEEKWAIYALTTEAKSLLLLSAALYSVDGVLLRMPSFVSMLATFISTDKFIESVIKSLENQGEMMILKAKEEMRKQSRAAFDSKKEDIMLRGKIREVIENRKKDIANFISNLAADLTKEGEHTYTICACLLFGLTLYPELVRMCDEKSLATAILSCAVINEVGPIIGIIGAYVYTDENGKPLDLDSIDENVVKNSNDSKNKANSANNKEHKIPHLIVSSAVKIVNAYRQVGDEAIANLICGVLAADGIVNLDDVEIVDVLKLPNKKT